MRGLWPKVTRRPRLGHTEKSHKREQQQNHLKITARARAPKAIGGIYAVDRGQARALHQPALFGTSSDASCHTVRMRGGQPSRARPVSSGRGRVRNEDFGPIYRNDAGGKGRDDWEKARTGSEGWDVSGSAERDRVAPERGDVRPGLQGSPRHAVQGNRGLDAELEEQGASRGTEREAKRWWPIVTPLAALLIGVTLLLPTARHEWALSIFRQPSRYTALSFNKPWALPSVARKGKPIALSFTVGDQEGRSELYRYVLTESAGSFSRKISESQRIVPSGGTWTVTTVVRPICRLSPCRVEVSLPGHPEVIDFLVELRAGS
jgi:hypothetical protein